MIDEDLNDEVPFPDKFLKNCMKGEVIFQEGSTGSHMYVVAKGRVNIVRRNGDSEVLLSVLDKGNIFGEMALVDSLPRSATAVAAEDGTRILEIDQSLFVYIVGQQPAFALTIIKTLSLRLRSQMNGYETSALKGKEQANG